MIILPIGPWVMDVFAAGIGTKNARYTPALKVIVTYVARSGAHVLWKPANVIPTERYGMNPHDGNTYIRSPRLNDPVFIYGVTTVSSTIMESQEINIRKGINGSVEVRNAQPFHTSINRGSHPKYVNSLYSYLSYQIPNHLEQLIILNPES